MHITLNGPTRKNLNSLCAVNVATDLSCHNDDGGFDLSLYPCAFSHNQLILAANCPLDFALNSKLPPTPGNGCA